MGAIELSRKAFPSSVNPTDAATRADLLALAGGKRAIGSYFEPMKDVWPAPDTTNGPLLTDPGMTTTAPSLAGLTPYQWDSGKFNYQSQYMVAVPSSNGPATGTACLNVTTDRGDNYGSTGIGFPCYSDFGFITDSDTIVLRYWGNPYNQAVNTSYHETQIFVEHNGRMKGIREAPAVWLHGQATNQVFYRVLTFKQARSRRFRIMMSANCFFMGVYVKTGSLMMRSRNLPLLFAMHGNSWAEGAGNVYGNSSGVGVTYPASQSLLYSNLSVMWAVATGMAVICLHQGGTQWVNANGGITATDAVGKGFSPTWSVNQVNNLVSKFGARNPIPVAGGNYNDGNSPVSAPLRANYGGVVLAGLDRVITGFTGISKATVPIIMYGGEPKAMRNIDTGYVERGQTNLGILDAAASRPNNVIGAFDFSLDYEGDITPKLGADGLHPKMDGADSLGDNETRRIANFLIPTQWVEGTLAWAG